MAIFVLNIKNNPMISSILSFALLSLFTLLQTPVVRTPEEIQALINSPENAIGREGIKDYVPTAENLASRESFRNDRFGIFIHWGVYSMLARGEWVMHNEKISFEDYSKIPAGFYPSKFNADEWVGSIKASGAKYITITSRHHDGFSMFKSSYTPYNIVDATPFGRDVLKELADACKKQGIKLNFYYSLLDWSREDYEKDYDSYLDFMCNQLTELLTCYGPIGCIWFDGDWHKNKLPKDGGIDGFVFDWKYDRIYKLIHELQPGCLVSNNHHKEPIPGEDTQVFERDVPGENKAGYGRTSHIDLSLPLETCKTMMHSWGYSIRDKELKTPPQLIRILVNTVGRDANLLLNVGPRSDGKIPELCVANLAEMGKWMEENGETLYGTRALLLKPQPWGVVTSKEDKVYVHVMEFPDGGSVTLPLDLKVKSVKAYKTKEALKYRNSKNSLTVKLPLGIDCSTDYIVEITCRQQL